MDNNQNGGHSGLGIAALILSILGCTSLIGLILAIIDLTNKNGKSKTLAKISLGICGFWLLIGILGSVLKKDKGEDTSSKTEITTESVVDNSSNDSTEVTSAEDSIEAETEVETEAENETTKVEAKFENNVVVLDDYTIEILEYKIIQPGEEGNKYGKDPVIAFWYNTTNTSGKDINPSTAWIYIMTAVQDNDPNMVNELNVGLLPDDSFGDSQLATIKEGGTVENAVAYNLTDLETPVVLTAKDGLLGKEIGSQTFEVK
ncbi:protein of unknown function [Lachnospiraceae bacterium NE2001]|nr:protein of unknown function [Lachnospiraceae bacterium NE2001]